MFTLSIDLHSSKSTIRLSFHFQNVTYESLDNIYCSKFSIGCNHHVLGWRPQPCVSSLQLDVGCPVVIAAAIPDAILFPTDECFAQEVPERRPNMSEMCSMGFKSGLMAGQGTEVMASLWRYAVTALARWGLALSSIYTGLVASGWLSKWGTTGGCKTSLMYWSPIRLPCMVTKSRLQSWEIHPKPLLSLHRKEQLAGCSLGHRLYFCVSKPSSAVVTWSRNRLSSDQWILRHVLKFQSHRAKHHAKRVRRCRSSKNGRLMTLLDLSPADFRRF
jgi:hypothetical protein